MIARHNRDVNSLPETSYILDELPRVLVVYIRSGPTNISRDNQQIREFLGIDFLEQRRQSVRVGHQFPGRTLDEVVRGSFHLHSRGVLRFFEAEMDVRKMNDSQGRESVLLKGGD